MMFRDANHRVMRATVGRGQAPPLSCDVYGESIGPGDIFYAMKYRSFHEIYAHDRCEPILVDEMKQRKVAP